MLGRLTVSLIVILGTACVKPPVYESAYSSGDYSHVKEIATRHLQENPVDFESHLFLGKSLFKLGDRSGAFTEFRSTITVVGDSYDKLIILAKAISETKDRKLLVECFDQIRFTNPQAALDLMGDSFVAPILLEPSSKTIFISKRPQEVITKKRRTNQPNFLTPGGGCSFETTQDPDGRPVRIRYVSGDTSSYRFFAFGIVQKTFARPSDAPADSNLSWLSGIDVTTETRTETIQVRH